MTALRRFSERKRKREAQKLTNLGDAGGGLPSNQSRKNGNGFVRDSKGLIGQHDANTASPDATSSSDLSVRGPGANRERDPSGMPAIQAAKLEQRAIREGWAGNAPWPLEVKPSDFEALKDAQGGELTLKQQLIRSVFNGLLSGNKRLEQIAVRSGVVMQAQNLSADQHADRLVHSREMHAARSTDEQNATPQSQPTQGPGVLIVIPHDGRNQSSRSSF